MAFMADRIASTLISESGRSTPLHYAAQLDRRDAAAQLLAAGASPAARNSRGDTPLHLCKSVALAHQLLLIAAVRLASQCDSSRCGCYS